MTLPFGQIVTILRDVAGGVDSYGDPVPASTTRIDVPGCSLAPRTSTEPTVIGRQGVIVGQSLYLPVGTDIRFTDRVEIHGGGTVVATGLPVTPTTAVVYMVEGEPGTWSSPLTGTDFGVEVAIKKAAG